MAKKKSKPATTTTKKRAAKRQTYRDAPGVPTAKQVERSISGGKSLSLEEFVKGVKL
jgi:hypothetical protein